MSQTEPTERPTPEAGAPEKRLAAAAKQLRIVRENLPEDAETEAAAAHVEVAIREAEAARHHVE